jgi:hypothetical protein
MPTCATHSSENLAGDSLWHALAQAAEVLLRVASAHLGKGPPLPVPPPALSPSSTLTVAELVNAFLTAKAVAGRSEVYLEQLHVHLGGFAKGRARRAVAGVTANEISAWALSPSGL